MAATGQKVRLAIFGVGMHFQETYTTAFRRPEVRDLVELVWVTDLSDKKEIVTERCRIAGQTPHFIGIHPFEADTLPEDITRELDDALAKMPVDAVLVSTTPEQHRAYTAWALHKQLAVLIDKPITTQPNAAHDQKRAMKILEDWQALDKLAQETGTMLMVNSHRRFHPAYHKVGELLQEVADEYGFGVTSISSFNSDGQWRMPNELVEIDYHGFNTGNGVLSHFGYHYLDLAATWYRKGTPANRRADTAAISSSFSLAQNYARQITAADAKRVLAAAGEPAPKPDSKAILDALRSYGEVDAFGSIEMLKEDVITAHISMQMVHSGLSQRAWTKPATNLYKENGRLRWENHLIQQGPLHAIEIRSFQAVQPSHFDPEAGLPRWELGGADQLEINIFRNKLIGGKTLETIKVQDLLSDIPKKDVVHEDVKAKAFQLFISIVAKQKGIFEQLRISAEWSAYVEKMLGSSEQDLSLISTHHPTVAFMAGMYASFAQRQQQPSTNERIRVKLSW